MNLIWWCLAACNDTLCRRACTRFSYSAHLYGPARRPCLPLGNATASSTWNCACPGLCGCHRLMLSAQSTTQKLSPTKSKKITFYYMKQPPMWGVNKQRSSLRAVTWGELRAKQDPECPEHFTEELYGTTRAEGEISNSLLKGGWRNAIMLNRHLQERHCTFILLERKQLYKMCRGRRKLQSLRGGHVWTTCKHNVYNFSWSF